MSPHLRWWLTVLSSVALGALLSKIFWRETSRERGGGGPEAAFVARTLEAAREEIAFPTEELASRLRDPRVSLRELKRLGEAGAVRDPVAAVRAAREIPGYDNRGTYLSSVLAAWGERDGVLAAQWVLGHFKGEQLGEALYQVADGWAESDPAGAGAWFLENTEGTVRIDSLWEVMEAWGRKDPVAAAAWSETFDEELKWEVIDGLADGWAAVDPKGAAAFAGRMAGEDHGTDLIRTVVTQWAAYDPGAAVQWAATLRHEAASEAVHMEIGEIWAASDPLAAARWADAQEDPGRARWSREGVARGWAAHDPGAALDWMLPDHAGTHVDEGVVGEIVSSWSDVDPRGVSEWLDARSSKAGIDPVLRHFSASILEMDPAAALVWAGEIADPEVRKQHLHALAGEWLSLEGSSAIAAIEALGLSIDMKAVLGE